MPSKKISQAERRASKKQEEEPEPTNDEASKADLIGTAKEMGATSVIASLAPGIVDLGKKAVEETKATFKEGATPKAAPSTDSTSEESEKKPEEEENKENENEEKPDGASEEKGNDGCEEKKDKSEAEQWKDMKKLGDPLNCLGLGGSAPQSSDAARTSWKITLESVKDRETNKKKKSSQAGSRMKSNTSYFLPQYLQILLIWMCIRALVFRTFFASLPWLVVYQIISVRLPLSQQDLPSQMGAIREKVPLNKVPVSMRLIIAYAIHCLMWCFFIYEVVVHTYWIEDIILVGLCAFHAYEVRPVAALN